MAESLFLDTHVVVWLATKERGYMPGSVIKRIESSSLSVSPMTILEMQYLVDAQKINLDPLNVIEKLNSLIGLEVNKASFESVINEALALSWTRDPFDRFIVAQASMLNAPFLTKDRQILRHYPHAVWEDGA